MCCKLLFACSYFVKELDHLGEVLLGIHVHAVAARQANIDANTSNFFIPFFYLKINFTNSFKLRLHVSHS